MEDAVIKKWSKLIEATVNYYVHSLPTGISDSEWDELERRAVTEDGFYVRDYVFANYLKGTKTKNERIEKIKKIKVTGSMISAIVDFEKAYGSEIYCDLKYDGSSLAIYLDSSTGIPRRVVGVGNLSLDDYGVDHTWKLLDFLPKKFPKGIAAIQAEALVDLDRITDDPERARQKSNGLINSKYCDSEVKNFLTIRAYRYYTDDSNEGKYIDTLDYRDVLNSFDSVLSPIDGHVMFAPAQVWKVSELLNLDPSFCNNYKTRTNTGYFLNDGWVLYDSKGKCINALKFSGAGESSEVIKTKVKSIQWNNQSVKGKDSWSANVIIDPVVIKGCTIKKPSAGSVSNLVKNNITPGAEVSIILANSTIPMVSKCFSGGNGVYSWPVCSCGYRMSEKDVYGSLLKCGNPNCTDRYNRMKSYVDSLNNVQDEINLNKLLVIDRFKWENTDIDIKQLLHFVEIDNFEDYKNYLLSFLSTSLQKNNLILVSFPSFRVLRERWLVNINQI